MYSAVASMLGAANSDEQQRLPRHGRKLSLEGRKIQCARSQYPAGKARRQLRANCGDTGREIGAGNQIPWVCDIDRVRQHVAGELRIDQRHHDADARQPKPDGQILGAVRHQQRDGISALEALRDGPAGILIAPLPHLTISHRGFGGEQCRRCVEFQTQAGDQLGKRHTLIADVCRLCQRPKPSVAGEF